MVGGPAQDLVTVVVPVWDAHVRYLDAALRSVCAQCPAPRVLVVDNRSTAPVSVPAGVRLVRLPERVSVGKARTYGLAAVATPFVVFWDADDVMPAGALAALLAAARAVPGAVLACGRIVEADGVLHHWPRPRLTRTVARAPGPCAAVGAVSSLVPAIGAVIRTAAVRDAGGFPDLDTGDDWVVGVLLSLRGRLLLIDEVTRIYRRHPDAVWPRSSGRVQLLAHCAAVRAALVADPRTPAWLRRGLPLLAAAQWLIVTLARPCARRVRRARAAMTRADG